jgi:hypothetical protein
MGCGETCEEGGQMITQKELDTMRDIGCCETCQCHTDRDNLIYEVERQRDAIVRASQHLAFCEAYGCSQGGAASKILEEVLERNESHS